MTVVLYLPLTALLLPAALTMGYGLAFLLIRSFDMLWGLGDWLAEADKQ